MKPLKTGLALLALAHGAEAAPPPPLLQTVEVRRASVALEVAPRGGEEWTACDLEPADLVLRQAGEPVAISKVEAPSAPLLSVLLLDVSGSMRAFDRLHRARLVAADYLRRMPPGETAVLMVFDDTLRLVHPPSGNRDSLIASLDRLEPGHFTALWDALEDTVTAMRHLARPKAVLIFTDGGDSASAAAWGPEPDSLVRLDANVAVYPLMFDGGPASGGALDAAGWTLRRLAEGSGGQVIFVRRRPDMHRLAARIRRGVSRRRVLVFEPRPQGGRLELIPARPLACRIRLLGRTLDVAGNGTPTRVAAPGVVTPLPACAAPAGGWRISWTVEDVIRDGGILYDPEAYRRRSRLRVLQQGRPRRALRQASAWLPPPGFVRDHLRHPVDLLLFLAGTARGCTGMDDLVGEGLWVHGRTFLALRETLAFETLSTEPGYLAAPPPAGGDVVARTADWYGDLEALDLVREVETEAVRGLLPGGAGDRDRRLAALVDEAGWSWVRRWFSPGHGVRVRVPLVPLFDPRRRSFGYVRIFLPRPPPEGRPLRDVPRAPRAFQSVRWMLQQDPEIAALLAQARLETVETRPLGRREVRALRRLGSTSTQRDSPGRAEAGVLRFRLRGRMSAAVFYYLDDSTTPQALALCGPGSRELEERLRGRLPGLDPNLVCTEADRPTGPGASRALEEHEASEDAGIQGPEPGGLPQPLDRRADATGHEAGLPDDPGPRANQTPLPAPSPRASADVEVRRARASKTAPLGSNPAAWSRDRPASGPPRPALFRAKARIASLVSKERRRRYGSSPRRATARLHDASSSTGGRSSPARKPGAQAERTGRGAIVPPNGCACRHRCFLVRDSSSLTTPSW